VRHWPSRSISTYRSKSSGSIVRTVCEGGAIPALATSTSIPPAPLVHLRDDRVEGAPVPHVDLVRHGAVAELVGERGGGRAVHV
jgi:hypothetical protein